MGLVISLCDRTGNMVKPWLEAGHDCIIVDLQHKKGLTVEGRLRKVGSRIEDFVNVLPPEKLTLAIGFAFPPCTHVAVSGARHFQAKGLGKLIESLTTLHSCNQILEKCLASALENPVSVFSSYWRKPDFIFNPFQYADQGTWEEEMYSKKTCLWTTGKFVMPKPTNVFNLYPNKIHYMGGGKSDERSITPTGFARAVYEADKHLLS